MGEVGMSERREGSPSAPRDRRQYVMPRRVWAGSTATVNDPLRRHSSDLLYLYYFYICATCSSPFLPFFCKSRAGSFSVKSIDPARCSDSAAVLLARSYQK